MVAERNKEVKIAYVELKKLSEDESNQMIFEAREKAVMDWDTRLWGAEARGKAEGIAEGIAEGKIKSCINMIARLKSSVTNAMEVVELEEEYKEEIIKKLEEQGIKYSL